MASSMSKCRECLNKANSFCYVCGDFTTVAQRRTITSLLRTAYFHYFDCKIGDQDKSWAPHICCKPCYNGLTAWFNGKKVAFNFAVPMVNKDLLSSSDEEMPWREDSAESISLEDIESTYSGTSGNEPHWILLVICICQNSSQSSWLLDLNSRT